MGQANRAPDSNHKRRLQITEHAIQRYRERVDEEFKARPDWDIGNLLDERIHWSGDREDILDHSVGGVPTVLVRVDDRKGQSSFAVIRNNTAITVLTPEQYANNYEVGAWIKVKKGSPPRHPLIVDTGPKQQLINPAAVADALGAEIVVSAVGTAAVETIAARLATALLHLHRAERDVERFGTQVETLTRELDEALAKEP